MLDQKQLKIQGLRYGRTLQIAIRTAAMLSVNHIVASMPLQQSFDSLNSLVKQTRQLTFGFVDKRVIINEILTTDRGLAQVENEFLKRGISAVRFDAGITLTRYKQVISILSTPTKLIQERGGARAFLEQNRIEGVRIFPAGKNQKRVEGGDTVLEMDPEVFLSAQSAADLAPYASSDAMAMLFQSACLERPETSSGGRSDLPGLIGTTVEAALVDDRGDAKKACVALAQILQEVRPDFVFSVFSAERQQELSTMPPDQIAAEFIEDTAVQWAGNHLISASTGPKDLKVEEDVMKVLVRALKATQMADRLARKLVHFVDKYALPSETCERIKEELRWVALPPEQKHVRLLRINHFSTVEFRRLVEHVKELLSKAGVAEATELASHYFGFLDAAADEIQPEELSRAPELIRTMAAAQTGFAKSTATRFLEAFQRDELKGSKHCAVVNSLVSLSQSVAIYEDYEVVQTIGSALQRSWAKEPSEHSECCENALKNLLPKSSVERIIEMYIQKHEDPTWLKNAAIILRWTGSAGMEVLCQQLERETTATHRIAIMRLIGYIGSASVEIVRQRLVDERWYVVRNACMLLGELRDPELLQQLAPVLRHPDDRVQWTAANVIIKSRAADRAHAFAVALPHLRERVVEQVLDELLFLKDPASLPGLEEFIFGDSHGKSKVLGKAVQAVADIPAERRVEVLVRILSDKTLEIPIRKLALGALSRNRSELSQRLLAEFASRAPNDPIAMECQQAMDAAGRQ